MVSIDLTPQSYRGHVRARKMLRLVFLTLAGISLIVIGLLATVHWQLHRENQRLVTLRGGADQIALLRQEIDGLKDRKGKLEQAAAALAALRGDSDVRLAVLALDRSLNEGVWLSSFRFQRVHQLAAPAAQMQPDTRKNAVILLAADQASDRMEQTWLVSTRIEIKGSAMDHAALGEFINEMSRQQRVSDVRFLNSYLNELESGPVVEFGAEATIQARERQL